MNDLSRRDVALLAAYAALLVLGLAWIVRAIGGGAEAVEPSDSTASADTASVEEASVRGAELALASPPPATDAVAVEAVAAVRTLVIRVVAREGGPAPTPERVRLLAVRECPDAAFEDARARASAVLAELAPDDAAARPPALAFTLRALSREPLHVAAYFDARLAAVDLVGGGEDELVLTLGEPATPPAPDLPPDAPSAAPRAVTLDAADDPGAAAAELVRARAVRGELRRASDGPRVFPVLLEPLASGEASAGGESGEASSSAPSAPAAILARARGARLEYSREDGRFQFAPVAPGRYRLRVPSPDEGIPWPSDDELASRPLTIEVGAGGAGGAGEQVLVLEPARRVRVEAAIDRETLLWWELRDEGGAALRVAPVAEGRIPDLLLPGGRYEIVLVGVAGERARRAFVVESVAEGGELGVVVVELGEVR